MPVGLLTNTEARMRKAGNPFGEIRKVSRRVGWVGVKYQEAVNREAERQDGKGGFKSGKRPFGEWLIPNKVARTKGKYFLRTESTPGQRNRSRDKVLAYLDLEGNRLDNSRIEEFLIKPLPSRKQKRAGLEEGKQIEVREFAFNSIEKIRIGGEIYRLVP